MPRDGARPGRHPDPPADLSSRGLPILHRNGPWFRLHPSEREALHFGRARLNRFDAPAGEYGVLYAGSDPQCAFVETYGQSTGMSIVTTASLAGRCLSKIEAARPLRLVDLTGAGLARVGADERLCSGEHAIAQRWALSLWRHPSVVDGLLYRARHDPSRFSVAIFERAGDSLRAVRLGSLSEPQHLELLAGILDTYGFGLVDSRR